MGSGRKYLRGPRGTGFIYVNSKILNLVCPNILDLKNSKIFQNKVKIIKSKIFENFEYSPALKLGLTEAIDCINKKTIQKIELDIKKKSTYLRLKLKKYNRIKFYENTKLLSGINTFNIEGINSEPIYNYLIKKEFSHPSQKKRRVNSILKKNKIKSLNRISIHSYNTFYEIDYLIKCLIDLIQKISNIYIYECRKRYTFNTNHFCSLILAGAIVGFVIEISLMVKKMKVELADLLLLFIYVEVMGMIRVYLANAEIRITYPLVIAITAISRLIILQKKIWIHQF